MKPYGELRKQMKMTYDADMKKHVDELLRFTKR